MPKPLIYFYWYFYLNIFIHSDIWFGGLHDSGPASQEFRSYWLKNFLLKDLTGHRNTLQGTLNKVHSIKAADKMFHYNKYGELNKAQDYKHKVVFEVRGQRK